VRATLPLLQLIKFAVEALSWESANAALKLENAGRIDCLITGVSTKKTSRRRSKKHTAGHCYFKAGWEYLAKSSKRADVWLGTPWVNNWESTPPGSPGICGECGGEMAPTGSTSKYPNSNTWTCSNCGNVQPEMGSFRLRESEVTEKK
jgi:hypothetical protein